MKTIKKSKATKNYAVINSGNGLFYNSLGNHEDNTVWGELKNATLQTKSFWIWVSKKNNANITILKTNIVKVK